MSERRPLSNAPGQYDYPPAARSSDTSTPAYDFDAIPPRLQSLRQRLSDERFRAAFDFDPPYTPHRGAPPMPRSPADSDSHNRMRSVLRAINENEGNPPSELALPPTSPGSGSMAPPARRRARPSERFQRLNDQRSRRLQSAVDASDSTLSLYEASDRLAQSNDELRSLLDRPLRPDSRPSRFTENHEDMIRASESQHRRKRRRIEGPTREHIPPLNAVNYGWHGQVRPAPLRMEVRHVDSEGVPFDYHMVDRWDATRFGRINNVLRDDSTAYCSGKRRANIVFQHPDERLFTLSRLVIKTPDMEDYGNCMLEGLVFTSREIDPTFDHTARYQIYPRPSRRFAGRAIGGQGGLGNYLRSSGRAENALRNLPPLHPVDEMRHHHQVSADCEADSQASDSDDVFDDLRPGSADHQASTLHSELESGSESSSDLVFPGISPPADHPEWTSSRLRQGLWREGGLDLSEDDDGLAEEVGNDTGDPAAQSDFDEVLRRGMVVSAERRRRRMLTRERVQRQQSQRRAAAQSTGAGPSLTPPSESAHTSTRTRPTSTRTPGLLEPIEPPARPEDFRWLDLSRTFSPDPRPAEADVEPDSAGDTSKLLADGELMEANAFFSTHRPSRLRFSTDASAKRTGNPSVSQDAVTVSYKAKKYGGRITIDFEAPVSARFILLKLWKSHRAGSERARNENVVLSRVRAEGYCGPRLFPAVELA